jgi:hypothetical protein
VFIPPSTPAAPVASTSAERRTDAQLNVEKNVYYNHMTPMSLLDVVAFQSK